MTELQRSGSSRGLRRLPVLLAGNGLVRIAGGAGGVLIGLYFSDQANRGREVSASLVGALGAVAYGAELAAAVPMGVMADVLTPSIVMILGSLLGAAGAGVLSVVRPTGLFFLARALDGVSGAATAPSILAHLTDITAGARHVRGRVMSFFELTFLAGIALGSPIGAGLWRMLGPGAFAAVAMLYCLSAAAFRLGSAAGPARQGSGFPAPGPFPGLDTVRRLAPAWLSMNAIVGLWLGPMLTFLLTRREEGPQYLNGLFADAPGQVGWVFAGYSVVFGAGVGIWSRYIDRVGPKRVLGTSLVAMFAACAGLYALNHSTEWDPAARIGLIAGLAAIVMLESGFTPAALALLADASGAGANRGTVMGIYSALFGVGALIGALLGSLLGPRFGIDGLVFGTIGLAALALMTVGRLELPETSIRA